MLPVFLRNVKMEFLQVAKRALRGSSHAKPVSRKQTFVSISLKT